MPNERSAEEIVENDFHEHLDQCCQCRENVFDLCSVGSRLLEKLATDGVMFRGLMQWNKVLRK